jgi:hypothetical protein
MSIKCSVFFAKLIWHLWSPNSTRLIWCAESSRLLARVVGEVGGRPSPGLGRRRWPARCRATGWWEGVLKSSGWAVVELGRAEPGSRGL